MLSSLLRTLLLPAVIVAHNPTPSDLGCLWWESELGTTIFASDLQNWNDQLQSEQLSAPTSAQRLAVVAGHFNGIDGYQGDGANDILSLLADHTVTGDFSIFKVFELATLASLQNLQGAGATDFLRVMTGGAALIKVDNTANLTLTANGSFVVGTRYLMEVHRDGSNNFTVFRNGTDVTSGTPNRAGPYDFQHIGARNSGNGHSQVIHGAFAVCDSLISGDARTDLRNHFQRYLD